MYVLCVCSQMSVTPTLACMGVHAQTVTMTSHVPVQLVSLVRGVSSDLPTCVLGLGVITGVPAFRTMSRAKVYVYASQAILQVSRYSWWIKVTVGMKEITKYSIFPCTFPGTKMQTFFLFVNRNLIDNDQQIYKTRVVSDAFVHLYLFIFKLRAT